MMEFITESAWVRAGGTGCMGGGVAWGGCCMGWVCAYVRGQTVVIRAFTVGASGVRRGACTTSFNAGSSVSAYIPLPTWHSPSRVTCPGVRSSFRLQKLGHHLVHRQRLSTCTFPLLRRVSCSIGTAHCEGVAAACPSRAAFARCSRVHVPCR